MSTSNWSCYILVLHVSSELRIASGKFVATLRPGFYFYVGSGKKPGVLLARLIRHMSKSKRIRWHIDLLTINPHVEIKGFYLINSSSTDCESSISQILAGNLEFIKGFGSTDKPRDKSHLFICDGNLEDCLQHVYSMIENAPFIGEIVYASF
ncbi:MAG: GIY-YIG nuclease family protein [Desulfurococcaceae archaeon]